MRDQESAPSGRASRAAVDAGPAALRAARQDARLTQEQLAERSGVSVRTVRGLETRKITNPHRATLLALVDGLFTDPEQGDNLVRAWTTGAQQLSLAALFEADGSFADLLNEMRAQIDTDLQMLSIARRSRVGVGRVFSQHVTNEVAAALHDDVGRRPFLNAFFTGSPESARSQRLDLADIIVDQLHNCSLGDRIDRPEFALFAAEVLFGQQLAEGQTHSYGYRIDCSRVPPADDPDARRGGSSRQGIRRRLPQLLLEVAFDGRPPDRIWETRGSGNEPVGPLELSAFGSVHLIKHNVDPGFAGISWQWDD